MQKNDVVLFLLSKQKRFIDLLLSIFVKKRTSLVALQKCKIFKFLCCQWLRIWHFANDFAALKFNDLLKFNSVSDYELFDNWCPVVTFANNCRHVFSSKDKSSTSESTKKQMQPSSKEGRGTGGIVMTNSLGDLQFISYKKLI